MINLNVLLIAVYEEIFFLSVALEKERREKSVPLVLLKGLIGR